MKTVILCVEDDLHTLDLLTYVLEDAGYRVIQAENGTEALALSVSEKPSLVLLDFYLPDITGDEVCRRLRSQVETEEIPIIMLSIDDEEELKVICFESGADDYIAKPFSTKILVARVRALLRRKAMMEEAGQ